jgi:cytochrome P450
LLNRPEYVRHFLHAPGWTRTDLLKIALGESTLSADGPEWRKKRRIVQPGFERARIEGFGPLMVDEARKLADAWAREEGPVDVDAAMMKLTLRIVVRSLFSADVEPHVETVSKALTQVIADLGALTSTLFAVPVAFAPDRNRRMKAALGDLDRVVFEILDERRARPRAEWPPDLLTTLLTARDPDTGDALDDAQLRDELVTMLVAGHETTATMLGWAWYLLGEHPEVEAAWHADLDARFGDRDPAPEDLLQPSFTRDLVQETLRLYPPVWAIARRVTETQALDGYRIEGRSAAFICPFLLHRHPGWWRDPERFDPSRFAEGEARIERYAYVPFARGPHMCSGHHFATLEGQIILAVLGRRFRLRKVPGHEVKPLPLVTLRFEGGLPMTLEPRG